MRQAEQLTPVSEDVQLRMTKQTRKDNVYETTKIINGAECRGFAPPFTPADLQAADLARGHTSS